MNQAEIDRQVEEDAFIRSGLDIPLDHELQQMSFVELASLQSSSESGSAKFNVVEREVKKRLAKDQTKINRCNIILGACIGGVFGLSGVVLGYYLKNDISPSSAVQQASNNNLAIKPKLGSIAIGASAITQPTSNLAPAPVQDNVQLRNQKP